MSAPAMALTFGYSVPRSESSRSVACRTSVQWGCLDSDLQSGIALQKWAAEAGARVHNVELQKVGDISGRGLVSTRLLYKGDRPLVIPSNLTITTDSEWTRPEVGKLVKELPDWPLLACYLLSEASLGKSSRWCSYISALPRRPRSILQWTVTDVEKHLSATSLNDVAAKSIQDVEETYKDLNARLFSKDTSAFPPSAFNMENFKWAFGILFSRLVRLPSRGEQAALVPFGDMLNHSTEVTSFLDFESSSNSITCKLDGGCEAGKELFVSYGKRTNAELLMANGFVPSGTNSSDHIDIKLALNTIDPKYQAKVAALKEHGLSSQLVYPLTLEGWSVQLTAFARLVTSSPSEAELYSELARAVAKPEKNKKQALNADEHLKAYNLILSAVESLITKRSSYVQDRNVSRGGSSLAKLAKELCESELRILYKNQFILRTDLRKLRYGSTESQERASIFDGFTNLFKRT